MTDWTGPAHMLEDANVVVVGATRRLGRAVATQRAANGHAVLLVAPDAGALEELSRGLGDSASACPVDVSTPSGAEEVVRRAREHFRGVEGDGGAIQAVFFDIGPSSRGTGVLVGAPMLLRRLRPLLDPDAGVVFATAVPDPPNGALTDRPDRSRARRLSAAALLARLAEELPQGARSNVLFASGVDASGRALPDEVVTSEVLAASFYLLSACSRVTGAVLRSEDYRLRALF